MSENLDFTDIQYIIKKLCNLIRQYKKNNNLINPQNIRNELAKLFGVPENDKTNIENLKEYFDNLCELVRLAIEAKNIQGQQGILVAPINLPTKFKELLEYIPKYNIYFEENFTVFGNEVPDIMQVTNIPETNGDLPVPYQFRYAFAGWYMDKELTTKVELGKKLNTDITLYAKWIYGKYSISYETFGGTLIPPSYTDATISANLLPQPNLEGYTFEGWYRTNVGGLNGTFSDRVDYGYVLTNNITLYARYIPNEYTITFVMGNEYAPQIEPITVAFVPQLPIPQDTPGYVFVDWFQDELFLRPTKPLIGKKLYEDITLYGKWEFKTYTVTLVHNAPDPNGNTPTEIKGQTVYDTSKYPIVNWLGHTFVGWYIDSDLSIPVPNGQKLLGDATVYALWDLFSITFEENGGLEIEGIPKAEKIPEDIQTAYIPTRFGYEFDGWYLDNNFANRAQPNTYLTSHLVLYAKWRPLVHLLQFDNNGHGTKPEDRMVATAKYYSSSLPYLEEPGYIFLGWYNTLDEANNAQEYKHSEFLIDKDTILYAGWKGEKYRIYLKTNKVGTLSLVETITDTIKAESSLILPNGTTVYVYEKTYYSTLDIQKVDVSTSYLYDFIPSINGNSVKIIFYFTTNSQISVNITITNHEYFSREFIPSESELEQIAFEYIRNFGGYEFDGWYIDVNNTSHPLYESKLISNIYLYAGFVKLIYTITFETNGGSKADSILVPYGNLTLDRLPTTTRPGYTFEYWYYLDPGGGEHIVDLSNPYAISSDTTLYAKWSEKSYTVYLDNGGATGGNTSLTQWTSSYLFMKNLTDLNLSKEDSFSKRQYFLDGFYLDPNFNNRFSKDFKLTSDVYVYTKWASNQWKITVQYNYPTYKPEENILSDYTIVVFEGQYLIDAIQKPQKKGYTFLGWSSTNSADNILTQEQIFVNSNVIIYGIWRENQYNINFYENGGFEVTDLYVSFFPNSIPTPKRNDYIFDGWFLDADLETPFTNEYYGIKMTEPISLYAKWSAILYNINFYYDSDGVVDYTVQLPKGTYLISNLITKPEKVGYDFVGWYNSRENANLAEQTGLISDYLVLAEGSTLNVYAGWKPQKYNIYYVDAREFTTTFPSTHTYGKDTILVNPYDYDDVFLGWSLTPDFSSGIISVLNSTQFSSDITLYAKWQGWVERTYEGLIVLGTLGETDASGITTYYGYETLKFNGIVISYTMITSPTISWVDEVTDSTIKLKGKGAIAGGTAQYKITVKYGKSNEYIISFNSNGGSGTMYYFKPDFSETTIPLNKFTKEGYNFIGWNTQADGSGISYSDGQLINLSSNITLYAQWQIKKFTLTYKHSYGDSKLLITDSDTGDMDYYYLKINDVQQGKLGQFSNPPIDYQLDYGTKIEVYVAVSKGDARSYINLNDNNVAGPGNSATYTLYIKQNTTIDFEFNKWYAGILTDLQKYWICNIKEN